MSTMSTTLVNPTTFYNHTFKTATSSAIESPPNEDGDYQLRVVTIVICIIVVILGTVGNGIVLLVFGLKWSKLKSCEMFMVSLAMADFLNASINPIRTLLEQFKVSFISVGHHGCGFIYFMSMTSMTVSALTLLFVSIDRFIIVKWPLHERPYHCTILCLIIFTWVAASGLGGVYLYEGHIQLHPVINSTTADGAHVYHCLNFMPSQRYVIFNFVVFFIQNVIPICVMTILYSLIVYELRRNTNSGIFAHCQRELKLRMSQNRKATLMILLIVIVFYVCILPTHIFFMWYIYNKTHYPITKAMMIFGILTMIQMCNSIANPIIYSRLHTSFRRDIVKLICPCFYNESNFVSIKSIFRSGSRTWRKRRNSSTMSSVKTRMSVTSLQFTRPILRKQKSVIEEDPVELIEQTNNDYTGDTPKSYELSAYIAKNDCEHYLLDNHMIQPVHMNGNDPTHRFTNGHKRCRGIERQETETVHL